MAIRKVKYNDEYIYIDDEVDEKQTGIIISGQKDVMLDEKEKEEIENTSTDIFGGKNEQ